jgi:hypothetical protein
MRSFLMRALLLVCFLSLPSLAFAQAKTTPDTPPTAKSWLADDIFFQRAHVNEVGATDAAVPDNIPIGPVQGYIRFWVPSNQQYTRFWFVTDKEGKLEKFVQEAGVLPSGFNVLTVELGEFPTAGPSGGQYKLIVLVVGANGQAAFSPYYEFRQL